MGQALSQPVELIRVQRRGGPAFQCAVAEMQGWRLHHEDAHSFQCGGQRAGAFWVLDGHGGEEAAAFGASALLEALPSAQDDAAAAQAMPRDELIESGFHDVDQRLRQHFQHEENRDKESGSTVVGTLVVLSGDGSYSVKLVNCGDSRAVVMRPANAVEASSPALPAPRRPQHLAQASPGAVPAPWPVICETVDHKPNHPTEKIRIEDAGGFVSEEAVGPARLDGNLAVSRGLGDFEFKDDPDREPKNQKVSSQPDIYELHGLPVESLIVLACDGVWDVLDAPRVSAIVRESLAAGSEADLGDIATKLVRQSLDANSRDNVTAMVVRLGPAPDYDHQDEMKNYEKLMPDHQQPPGDEIDEETLRHYGDFIERCKFGAPSPCISCHRWYQEMLQCSCKGATYCGKVCQKKDWKAHKPNCTAAMPRAT